MQTFFGWRWWDSPYFLLVITTLLWGGNAVAGKLAAGVVPPFTLTAARWVIACAIFYIICRPMLPAHREILRQHRWFLFALGAFGFAGFNFALYGALNFTTAINAAIEQAGMPMVILLGMVIFFGERARPMQILGALVAISGVIYTVARGDVGALLSLEVNAGDAIMLIGILCYAGSSIALRGKPQLPWQVLMFVLTLAASIVSVPASIVEVALGYWPAPDWRTPALIGFTALLPSIVSQTFFMRGVELVGPSRAGLFMNLVPIFGAILAVLIIGEDFHLFHAIGMVLVLGGIAIAETAGRR